MLRMNDKYLQDITKETIIQNNQLIK